MKGVILAAGYGTRFLPVTKTIPKEMLPLINKPAIDFIIEEFLASGIEDILVIPSRRKKALEDYLDREMEMEYIFKKENARDKLKNIAPPRARFYLKISLPLTEKAIRIYPWSTIHLYTCAARSLAYLTKYCLLINLTM